jgi:hypothetical protein
MQLTKTFTVQVAGFDEAALRKALDALRLTIQDYASELKLVGGPLLAEANLHAEPTVATSLGFAGSAFKGPGNKAKKEGRALISPVAVPRDPPDTEAEPVLEEDVTLPVAPPPVKILKVAKAQVVNTPGGGKFSTYEEEDQTPQPVKITKVDRAPVPAVSPAVDSAALVEKIMTKHFKKRSQSGIKVLTALFAAGAEGLTIKDLEAAIPDSKVANLRQWFTNNKELKFISRSDDGHYILDVSKVK